MENRLVGLPEHGVLLTGSPENPVIENRSGRTVIGYVCTTEDQNGYTSLEQPLLATSMQPGGIPDGVSLYARGAMPINPPSLPGGLSFATLGGFYSAPVSRTGDFPSGPGPMVRATLPSVIFADGQFVSTDERGAFAFERFSNRMQAVREVGMMAKACEWAQIEALATAPTNAKLLLERLREKGAAEYFERLSAAQRLVETRKFQGDAAARQLAEIFGSLPTPWRH